GLTTLFLGPPPEVFENQVRITSPNESKVHANPGIVCTGVTNRRIKGECDANAATATALERLRDRQLINCKVVER
ncbi:hypothetical protein ABTE37_19580, partial [Acinetobacter baumannii]